MFSVGLSIFSSNKCSKLASNRRFEQIPGLLLVGLSAFKVEPESWAVISQVFVQFQ